MPTPTTLPTGPTTEALIAELGAIETLAGEMTDEQWSAASVLPGWTNADIIAHVIGTESMLAGRDVEATRDVGSLAHVHNPIGELNEKWLDHYRGSPRAEVLAALREIIEVRTAALRGMSQADFDAEAMTPAGPDTYGRFMRIRTFDCWIHEVDLRDAIGAGLPSDPVPAAQALDEIVASLPFVVGKRAGLPAGSTVLFDITGLVDRPVRIEVAQRAALVESFADGDDSASVRLSLDIAELARLAGGRSTANPATVGVTGDAKLAEAILSTMAYVI